MITEPKKVLRLIETDNNEVLDMLLNTTCEIARTTIKHRLSVPSFDDLTDCCGTVEEHLEFTPDREHLSTFLALHPKLKSRVIEYKAGDTEVRSELINAICLFTFGTTHIEDPEFNNKVAVQWNRIWRQV